MSLRINRLKEREKWVLVKCCRRTGSRSLRGEASAGASEGWWYLRWRSRVGVVMWECHREGMLQEEGAGVWDRWDRVDRFEEDGATGDVSEQEEDDGLRECGRI